MKTYLSLHDDQLEVSIDASYNAVYRPAKVSGPPENCHPDESELDLTGFTVEGVRDFSDGGDLPDPTLSELAAAFQAAEDRIIAECWEDFHDNRHG